jgi:hypothetical protein
MRELGFFPKPTRFIYKQNLNGPLQSKGPSTSMGFYIQSRAEDKIAVRVTTRRRRL